MERKRYSLYTILTRRLINIFIIGLVYMLVEVIYNALRGSLVGVYGISFLSLCGKTSLWMLLVGGIAGALIGQLNEYPQIYNFSIFTQCIIGTFIVVFVEFLSGYILNIKLGLHIWDYSNLPFNLLGQICLPFAVIWFLLCPAAIWFDDIISYLFYGEVQDNYSICEPYKILFRDIVGKS